MKKRINRIPEKEKGQRGEIRRETPDYKEGLNQIQVQERIEQGWANEEVDASLLTVGDIVKKMCVHILT